ncbi:MAG: hypothetical protein ACRDNG_06660 [Gaiellaceae bacterium]
MTGAFSFAGRYVAARLLENDELRALGDDLLTSDEPARGSRRFSAWLEANAPELGHRLATSEERPWREAPAK